MRILGALSLIVTITAAQAGGGPLFVPTAQTRSVSGTASAEDKFNPPVNDSASDQAPDFGPYQGAAAADVFVDGATGSGGGQQSSSITASGIIAEGSMFAVAESWDFGAFAEGSAQILVDVDFNVTAETDYTLTGPIAAFDSGLAEISLLEGAIEIFGAIASGPATTLPINQSGTLQPGPHTLLIRLEASVFGSDFFPDYASGDFDIEFLLGAGDPGGEVPDGDDVAGPPLLAELLGNGDVRLRWSPSCRAADTDFSVYEGEIGDPDSLGPVTCSTASVAQWDVDPAFDASFFLVVPHDGVTEGSYGDDGAGDERPQSLSACRTQLVGAPVCP